MQIFKTKIFERVCSLFVLTGFLFAGVKIVGKALTPVSYATYFNHDIDCIEKEEKNVDLVFVGASRVYRSYIPEIFEHQLNMECVINAGSSSQPVCGTYYQLKDLLERVHPKNVVIGVTWDGIIEEEEPNQQSMLIVYDRLSLFNKIQFVLNHFEPKNLLYCLSPYRFKDNLSRKKIKKFYEEKQRLIQNNYMADTSQNEYYADTGFVYNKDTYETGTIAIREKEIILKEKISKEKIKYLDACINLCQSYGISVYLVTGVTSMMRIYNTENYQEEVDFYTDYAKKHGIIYHNLNYLLNREELLPDEFMHDYNHVNGEGAYRLSKIYAEILKKDIEGINTSNYFYPNLDELKKDVHRIIAVKGEITIDKGNSSLAHIVITSLQNNDVIPYYQLEISADNGKNFEVLAEWTEKSELEFVVPNESMYKLKVRAKCNNVNNAEAYQIYTLQ